jgi:SAM-dependent methyltransferase
MSLGYTIAYRIGFTPWERAGRGGAKQLASLFEREEADRGVPFGRALDLGCGTGAHTIELAARGWQATGVDLVPRALRTARQRAAAAGAGNGARFVRGDVTALEASDAGNGFSFLLDIGCFHGLSDTQRTAMARSVSAVASKDATLLLLAFLPGRRGPLPRGVSRADITAAFTGWTIIADEAADTSGMPGPLKNAAPRWYRLSLAGGARS